MKIVHPICCGMDVHKKSIVATLAVTENNITTYTTRTFLTSNADLVNLRTWLSDHNCHDVCMESTGKYWIPVYNILENHMSVVLTHPKYVRAIKGKKTDKKDSKWIADLFKHDLVRASFIPPVEFRALRELARYRFKLVCMRSSEKNRYQNAMTVSNITLANVLSDPFGVTATDIMHYRLSSSVFDEEHCKKLIQKGAKKKTELILESIRGSDIRPDQAFKMNEADAHMRFIDAMIVRTEAELFTRFQPYYEQVKMLANQLPGLQELSAALILAETGVDMSVFESAKHFVSWAGLAPTNNESAGKKKGARISRAGTYLKPLLIRCALSAIRDKKQPYFAIKYTRLKKRRGHKKAIVAIARMMLTCIYHMLTTGEVFNPSDYDDIMSSAKKTSPTKHQELNVDTAIAFLAAHGYDTSSLLINSC
jgi:transposase